MPRHIATAAAILTAILCALYGAGCDDTTGIAGPETLNTAGFPMTVGNQWEYAVTKQHIIQTNPAYADIAYNDTTTVEARVTWRIEGIDSVFVPAAYRMITATEYLSGPDSGTSMLAHKWFTVEADTLREVAHISQNGHGLPEVLLQRPASESVTQSSSLARYRVLVYPLEVGAEWSYDGSAHKKVVEARERISVPAGRIDAFRVMRDDRPTLLPQVEGYTNHGTTTWQWFSSVGVAKMRRVSTANAITLLDEWRDATRTDITEMELLSYDLR
jgi:hypothetical protein